MVRAYQKGFLYLLVLGILSVIIDISGVIRRPLERDYYTEFSYPLDLPNFSDVVTRYRNNEPIAYDVLNTLYKNLTYTAKATGNCPGPFRLIILVKSATWNFDKRAAIRTTWGFSRRFSNVAIKTVFLLGAVKNHFAMAKNVIGENVLLEPAIEAEIAKYNDIVRADFTDTYYNNTIKTMMGMRWLVETCHDFQYAFFVDDDMYVSVKNLLQFLRNPREYPGNGKKQERVEPNLSDCNSPSITESVSKINSINKDANDIGARSGKSLKLKKITNNWKISESHILSGADTKLYGGYVYFEIHPDRHKIATKWFLPLSEYPFNYLPPYVPAGAIIMSRSALMDIYYASFFTKHFRFDDVYIAVCAKKMGIEPFHSNCFRFWQKPVKDAYDSGFKYLIASHGYDDPFELRTFWNIQKTLGHA